MHVSIRNIVYIKKKIYQLFFFLFIYFFSEMYTLYTFTGLFFYFSLRSPALCTNAQYTFEVSFILKISILNFSFQGSQDFFQNKRKENSPRSQFFLSCQKESVSHLSRVRGNEWKNEIIAI